MLGAIIGDIVGSPYEFNNVKTKRFDLFTPCSHFTDDTVMTIAVAQSLMDSGVHNLQEHLSHYGRRYFYAGYGKSFKEWIMTDSDKKKPYQSYGNGAAMRVAAIPYMFKNFIGCEKATKDITNITHDHPQSITGALAVVQATWMARHRYTKSQIKQVIQDKYGYNLSFTLDDIRQDYKFDVSCDGSVPQAIVAFLESTDYEDAIRNAISIGGDSDTIACIAGGIAHAYYKYIPLSIMAKALTYLPDEFINVIEAHEQYYLKNIKPSI